jgi:hypothetical protein
LNLIGGFETTSKTFKGDDKMEYRQIKCRPYLLLLLVTGSFFLISACGEDQISSGDATSDTGSISFSLVWQDSSSQQYVRQSPSGDICIDYAIEEVKAIVQNSSTGEIFLDDWPCSYHEGTIDEVTTGTNMTLSISGTVAGDAVWQAQKTGISVYKDQNTDVGKVEMEYYGDDVTPPTITDHYPASGDTRIFLNTIITVIFSEKVVAASVNTSSCKLFEEGATNQATCTVDYDSAARKVTLKPNSQLKSNWDYTVIITKEVEDLAGIKMNAEYSWNFTTGSGINWFYNSETGHWYTMNPVLMSWQDAKAAAEAAGGYLVSINSGAENKWISDTFGVHFNGDYYWLGGNDIAVEGTWEWANGEPWGYMNWHSGEPNNVNAVEDALAWHHESSLNTDGYEWNDADPALMRASLIEYDTNYIFNNETGHWYTINPVLMSWQDAKAAAEAAGGYLVSINSGAENKWISDTFGVHFNGDYYWLGGSDIAVEGTWEWANGEPWGYMNWHSGEPNNVDGVEDALAWHHESFLNTDGYEWNDADPALMRASLIENNKGY